MKQSIVAWLCILAMACQGNNHGAERADNAVDAAKHQIALEVCIQKAIETNQTEGGNKAFAEYVVCADKADKDFGVK